MNSALAVLLLLTLQITGTVSQNNTNATTMASNTASTVSAMAATVAGEIPTPDWVIALLVLVSLIIVSLLMGCIAIIMYRVRQ